MGGAAIPSTKAHSGSPGDLQHIATAGHGSSSDGYVGIRQHQLCLAVLVLLVISTALRRLTLDVLGITLRPEIILLGVAVGLYGSLVLLGRQRLRARPEDLCILGYLLANYVASLLHAPNQKHSLITATLITLSIAGYFVVRELALSDSIRRRLVIGLLAVGLGQAAYSLITPFVWSLGLDLGSQYYPTFQFRALRGTLTEPNLLGSTAASIVVLAAGLVLQSSKMKLSYRWLPALAAITGLATTILSYSRGAWLGLAAGLIILALAYSLQPAKLLILGLHGVLGILLALATVITAGWLLSRDGASSRDPVVRRAYTQTRVAGTNPVISVGALFRRSKATTATVNQVTSQLTGVSALPTEPQPSPVRSAPTGATPMDVPRDRTGQWRLRVTTMAMANGRQHPLIGNGTNSFEQHFKNDPRLVNVAAWIPNFLLLTMHDSGLIGLAFLLAGLLWPVARVLRSSIRRRSLVQPGMGLAVIASLATLVVAYLFTTALWQAYFWVIFGLLSATSIAEAQESQEIKQVSAQS